MAASFTPSDLYEDLLCCVICYEPFADDRIPKALPCLHTFCAGCLQNTIHAHKRNHYRQSGHSTGHFPCPICKDVVRIPHNGMDGFRDDFRIRRMSEALNQTRTLLRIESLEEGAAQAGEGDGSLSEREPEVPELSLDTTTCEVSACFLYST